MKKNKMMRIASVLLVAVLVSTCAISGTFAKYVTSNEGGDLARVAKWGVVIVAGGDLFGQNYYDVNQTNANVPTVEDDDDKVSVRVGTASVMNLVAPGTESDSGMKFSITGTPEVRTKVDITVSAQDIYLAAGTYATMREKPVSEISFAAIVASTDRNLYTLSGTTYTQVASNATYNSSTTYYEASDDYVELSAAYYPVQYANANTNADDTNVTGIATAIAGLIDSNVTDSDTTDAGVEFIVTEEYDPNTDLSTTLNLDGNVLTWEWAFSVNDKADTVLGNLMAKAIDSAFTTDVVWIDTDSITGLKTGTPLAIDSSSFIVTYNDGSNDVEVGSLKTSFSVEITATQVD